MQLDDEMIIQSLGRTRALLAVLGLPVFLLRERPECMVTVEIINVWEDGRYSYKSMNESVDKITNTEVVSLNAENEVEVSGAKVAQESRLMGQKLQNIETAKVLSCLEIEEEVLQVEKTPVVDVLLGKDVTALRGLFSYSLELLVVCNQEIGLIIDIDTLSVERVEWFKKIGKTLVNYQIARFSWPFGHRDYWLNSDGFKSAFEGFLEVQFKAKEYVVLGEIPEWVVDLLIQKNARLHFFDALEDLVTDDIGKRELWELIKAKNFLIPK